MRKHYFFCYECWQDGEIKGKYSRTANMSAFADVDALLRKIKDTLQSENPDCEIVIVSLNRI